MSDTTPETPLPALDSRPLKPVDPKLVDPKLLEMLVCPVSRGRLTYDAAAQELVSNAGRLAFPIRDGVPIMLVSEARHLTD